VVRIQKRARDLCLLQKVQTGSGAQLANYSMGVRDVKLSIQLHLESRLRMSGVIPLLSLYAFKEGIGKTLSFL